MKRAAVFALFFIFPWIAHAEYADQLRKQMQETLLRFAQGPSPIYFHDAGIIARKADEAEQYELLVEILRDSLFAQADIYVVNQFKKISETLSQNPSSAASIIQELFQYGKYYEPSKEFLNTAQGKVLAGELVRIREDALRKFRDAKISQDVMIQGFQAYQKSALFHTKTPAEESDLRALSLKLGCSLSWAKKIYFSREQEFKTDYEQGIVLEEAVLTLQSPASDYTKAEWRGPWVFSFQGRDGIGKGTSEGILKVVRGQYDGDLLITTSQLSSTGRFNFPGSLSGERRTVPVEGSDIQPEVKISDLLVPLTGCEAEAPAPAKVENKNGKVLLA